MRISKMSIKLELGLALGFVAAAAPAHAQSIGVGGGMTGPTFSLSLPEYPRATFKMAVASGSDADYSPSTFVSFSDAVAQGNIAMRRQSKTVVEAAAEIRRARAAIVAHAALSQNASDAASAASPTN